MNVNLIINVIVHSLILFIFLSTFFFLFISKKEKESLDYQVDNLCKNRIPEVLKIIDDNDKNRIINWNLISQKAQEEIKIDDLNIDNYIQTNNNTLVYISIIIGFSLLLLCILFYVYYKYILNEEVHLSYLIKENIVVFIFIGAIEFLFFKNIASKYIPIFPVEISATLLDRIKYNIMNTMNQ